MFYEIPSNLSAEIDDLESQVEKFRRGELDAASFKAYRVPLAAMNSAGTALSWCASALRVARLPRRN